MIARQTQEESTDSRFHEFEASDIKTLKLVKEGKGYRWALYLEFQNGEKASLGIEAEQPTAPKLDVWLQSATREPAIEKSL
jgi:hypothetical protein